MTTLRIPGLCILLALCTPSVSAAGSPDLQSLARDFFAWRALTQPASSDDIPRIERPDNWVPDWSPGALRAMNERMEHYRDRLEKLDHTGWARTDSVDYLLLRSAIARVDFELNVLRPARRNPEFYVQQTLGSLFELVLQPPPVSRTRARTIVRVLESFPRTIRYAKENLTECVPAFADMAMPMLAEADTQLTEFGSDFARHMPSSERRRFTSGITIGAEALADFREWIRTARPAMNGTVAVGSEAYDGFLKKVALIPYSADELIAMGRQELARAIAFEQFESVRNSSLPPLPYFPGIESQMITSTHEEEAMRVFLPERGILDVPEWMGHYRNAPIPAYLFPLRWLAVDDDLTSVSRLGQDATKYIPAPSPDLSYFDRATAQDPRPILVHEGIPGHFFQLALSWSNPDPLRRHYFDSGANEGIGFYAEEMMLQNGYFDDRPRVREIIYNFMRLRAIRVEVDVRLARGEFSIDDAAAYLERMVPMSHADALDEAAFFASTPGQAITYQIGKLQIMKLIADARMQLGDAFNLRTLHNYIWLNGNVPIALLRWEYLGQRDEVDRLLGKK